MTQTLTQLISQVQAMFIDDGTRFTVDTITAAVRQALKDFNAAAPVRAAETQAVVSGQYEYELTDMTTIQVLDVLLEGTDVIQENHIPLQFTPFFEDGRAWIRLVRPLGIGNLIIRYLIPHTVNGLDAGVESTLADLWDVVLLDGACYYACVMRAASRIEVVNLNANVKDPWQHIAEIYKIAFDTGLALATQQPAVRVPDKTWQPRTWNDEWHNFQPE
jgi:hypothetical protein